MNSHWTDEYQDMIDDCTNREEHMNDWECNIIESLQEQLEEKRFISPKQIAVLERIWEKVTKNG